MTKKVKFIKEGNNVSIVSYNTEQTVDKLKPAVYTLRFDPLRGFYLTFTSDAFDIPTQIFGSTKDRADKVMATYKSRDKSTGILLTGHKGAGKTMLSSMIANEMLKQGFPVILIDEPYKGPNITTILDDIGECCLFFDEFGKIFNEDEGDSQNSLLSLFDGTTSRKRLILLTENEVNKVNDFMLNRPGRIYYHFKYQKLDEDVITDYCNAKGVSNDVVNTIMQRLHSSCEFSFDTLKAIVEEHNRFKDCNISDLMDDLNIEQPFDQVPQLLVESIVDLTTEEELDIEKPLQIDMPTYTYNTEVYYKHIDKKGETIKKYLYLCVKDVKVQTADHIVYIDSDSNMLIRCSFVKQKNNLSKFDKYFAV